MWWAVVTMTTIGYGDMYPETGLGQALGVICALSGVVMVAVPISVLSMTFSFKFAEHMQRQKVVTPTVLLLCLCLCPSSPLPLSLSLPTLSLSFLSFRLCVSACPLLPLFVT